jgi:uncharacterized protein involved in exopolysaccharide biosynthesis
MGPSPRTSHHRQGASNSPKAGSEGFDPHRLWQIVRRRRFYLILPVLVIGSVLGAGVTTISPLYQSSVRILLEDRSTGTDVDKLMTREARRVRDLENLVMVRETLMSQQLLTRVIRNLQLRNDKEIQEQARILQETKLPDQTLSLIAERLLVNRLRHKLFVSNQEGNLFLISMEDNDPYTAYKLTEAVTEAFVEEMNRRRVEGLIETTSFTDQQLESARQTLKDAETELEKFKRTRVIQDTLSNNPVNEKNSRKAEGILQDVKLDLTENEREITRIDNELYSLVASPPRNSRYKDDPQVQGIRDRLEALEKQDYVAQLGSSPVPASGITPEQQRIGVQRNRLNTRMLEIMSDSYPELPKHALEILARKAELTIVDEVLRRHQDQIQTEYDGFQQRIKGKPALEAELRRLEQKVSNEESIYNHLIDAENSNELRLAANESGFGISVRVLEPAFKAIAPFKPDKKKIALMGVVLALGIGMGAIFLAEYVDSSFKDVDEVEHILGLRVVGTLPRFADTYEWSLKRKRTVFVWRTAFIVTLVTAMLLFVLYYRQAMIHDRIQPLSPLTESAAPAREDSP